jgi:hypothetical protein
MQAAKTYLELIRERGKKGLPLERVYRQLFNREFYLTAYGKIYRNKGAMTHGITDETPDGMSLRKIDTIIELLRYERYEWLPARRTDIPKQNGKKRPLGMPTWSDKLVQEVMRLILEAYYEPQFSDHSHGFRPERGCHSALREIYYTWSGTTWFIEGDISHCFDKLDHELLLKTLSGKIHDGRFISLMRKLLDAGYLEDWTFDEYTIINTYQQEFRGLANYYRMAHNMHTLSKLRWIMEISLVKTLASKFQMSVPKVYEKYGTEITVDSKKYLVLQVKIPKHDKRKEPLVATWGGVSLSWDIKTTIEDRPSQVRWKGQSELVRRLLVGYCELCGCKEELEVHHVRAMKDLHDHSGRPKPPWMRRMITLRRKTLVLCLTCHDDIQYGRPLTRPIIALADIKAQQKGAMKRY